MMTRAMTTKTLPAGPIAATLLAALVAIAVVPAHAFYLPGIAPNDWDEGALLPVLANKLTSAKEHIPYDYYSLPVCEPADKVKSKHLSLGQLLMGERAEPTPYELLMKVPEQCKILCSRTFDKKELKHVQDLIAKDFLTRLNLDNMPVIMRGQNELGDQVFQLGFPVGYVTTDRTMRCLYNHLRFTVSYHIPSFPSRSFYSDAPRDVFRVVGFEVVPMSVDHKFSANSKSNVTTCPVTQTSQPFCFPASSQAGGSVTAVYTYDVSYVESPIEWATRWDPLLKASAELKEIQYFSIINSLLICAFLTAMVAMILLRTVYLDFARYNNIDDDEEIQEESGWKLIHGDVFRPPAYSGLLSVMVGSGIQILCMAVVALFFALLGFLSPANRGGLLTALLTLWVFASSVCGYFSARIYSGLGGTNKKSVTMGSAFFFSGTVFVVFFGINLMLWASQSTGAIPFSTLLLLLVMWFGISVPLNFIGAFIGYKQKAYEFPVRTNQIPREIPKTSTVSPLVYSLCAGVLPFSVIFLEMVMWTSSPELFYFFGFVAIVFVLLVITCAEVSIVMTYVMLCKEDYHHWWRSFVAAGSSGAYVFLYALSLLFSEPGIEGIHIVSYIVYMGYMALAGFAFSLMTGCIGFMCSMTFVRKIYNAVHIS
jgi:transmembrane 9 superfamily member 2/4